MNQLMMAFRLLMRDRRSGELSILIAALIIAVTSSTAISLFADRLQRTMVNEAADFLAADLVITSPTVLPPVWLAKAEQLQLTQSNSAEFSTVLMENDELLLSGVKAVTQRYPLRGYLKTTDGDYDRETLRYQGPESGFAWVEKRVLSALKLDLGDRLQVGEKQLVVNRILTYEPDKRGDLYSLSPRVMINADDLAATRVIQPGSHVHYFFHFIGAADKLKQFAQWAKPHLNPSQRLMDIHEDRPELGSALKRAERYLGLTSIIVILIAGVAIAMATRRYSERHFNTSAILRCLGCQQRQILTLYLYQFIIIGLIASAVGCLFGWLTQEALFGLLKNLLPNKVADPSLFAVVFGFITGIAILFGFSLPPLLRLKRVSPLRVLRRDLEPLPASAWLVYGLAGSLIAVLIWRYTQDLKMTATLLGTGAVTLLISAVLVYALLGLGQKLLGRVSLYWRFGLQGILKQRKASVSQILAFTITLVAMIISFSVRTDLLDDWQRQLPEQAPNHFAINIFSEQLQAFEQNLKQQNILRSRFYPIVRGRLVKINDIPVQQIVSKDSKVERASHRDLSLTWSAHLPEDNKLLAGQWWQGKTPGLVSVEKKLADSLKVKVGEQLTFTIGSQQLIAKIGSIRQVQWETMKPNFYMIFSPGTLDGFASTYITSFYLPENKKNYLNTLVKNYPSITILEVDLILKQFRTILKQLTQAINYLLYFALLAGFAVLFAAVYSTLDQRIRDGALMRTLGANRQLLNTSHLIEFSLLGLISGTLALIISEIISFCLYTLVMHMEYSVNYKLWLTVPFIAALTVAAAGCWGVRKVVKTAPLAVLRKL